MTEKIHTPDPLPDLTAKEADEARREGAKEYIKEGAKLTMGADTGTDGDKDKSAQAQSKRVPADLNTTFIADFLLLGVDAFEDRVAEKSKDPLDENIIKGLLALERNGQNRTPYVQALCKRLKVKSPYEVTDGGPGFTNDVTAVTAL